MCAKNVPNKCAQGSNGKQFVKHEQHRSLLRVLSRALGKYNCRRLLSPQQPQPPPYSRSFSHTHAHTISHKLIVQDLKPLLPTRKMESPLRVESLKDIISTDV